MRWALAARCLARRLEELPALRTAVGLGQLSWSKAELVAPVARGDEARWLEAAQRLTVRELRALLSESDGPLNDSDAPLCESEEPSQEAGSEPCLLTCTVDREEAWLFEATRALLAQLGTHGPEAQVEALLAEAQSTLLNALPPGSIDREPHTDAGAAQERWLEQLARWREEAEARCEANIPHGCPPPPNELPNGDPEIQEIFGRASAPRHRTEPRGSGGSNVCDSFGTVSRAAMSGCSSLAGLTARGLDALAQSLARSLAQRELAFCRLVREFLQHDGWRRLGSFDDGGRFHARYATETQYARERLGISRSSLLARRSLAAQLDGSRAGSDARAGRLPHIAEALGAGRIGIEAALQLVHVATPGTDCAWALHAQRRTIKHLKEDVAAALTAQRISGEADCPPPTLPEIEAFHELERAAASGRIWQPELAPRAPARDCAEETNAAQSPAPAIDQSSPAQPSNDSMARGAAVTDRVSASRGAWRVTLDSLQHWLSENVRMSAVPPDATRQSIQTSAVRPSNIRRGRITLRLRISRELRDGWRGLEEQARRWLPGGMSWLRFCCLSLWKAWHHLLAPNVAYGHIYLRDRHRCSSPVCTRRDVTPHHLKFRSQGGSDEDDNITAACVWCHLFGIHGGRIRATGSARQIRWELGRRGETCLIVEGRERRAA